jgi:hypothetical protein
MKRGTEEDRPVDPLTQGSGEGSIADQRILVPLLTETAEPGTG